MLKAFPTLAVNLYDVFVDAGFRRVDTEITNEYTPVAGDSTLGDYCKDHNVTLKLAAGIRYCYK